MTETTLTPPAGDVTGAAPGERGLKGDALGMISSIVKAELPPPEVQL